MTTIYKRLNADGYEFVNTVEGPNAYDDYKVLCDLHGPSRKHDWKPIIVTRGPVNRRSKGKAADLPYTHGAFLLRRSGVEALQDILEAHGELLPLTTQDGVELYVFNPRFVLDALDKERSVCEHYPEARLILVRKYVFIESMIRGVDIFYQPYGAGEICFSDRFVDRVNKAKLKGTIFTKLWSSDENG